MLESGDLTASLDIMQVGHMVGPGGRGECWTDE